MIHTKLMLTLLAGWLWWNLSKPIYNDECPRTPVTKPCIGIEKADAE